MSSSRAKGLRRMFTVLCVTLELCLIILHRVSFYNYEWRVQMAGRRQFFGQVIFRSVPQSSVSPYCAYGFDALRHV